MADALQHDTGSREGFARSLDEAVKGALADPRAPVVQADPSFAETFAASWRSGTSIGAVLSSQSLFTRPDENKPLTSEEVYTRLGKDGLSQNADAFYGVNDEKTYAAVVADVKRELEDRRVLQEAGLMSSISAGLLAGLTDPLNYVPGAAVTRGASLGNTVKKMVIPAAASATAVEGVIQGASRTKSAEESVIDIAAGTLFSAALGVGIRTIVGGRQARSINQRVERVVNAPDEVIAKEMRENLVASMGDAPAPVAVKSLSDIEAARVREIDTILEDVRTTRALDPTAEVPVDVPALTKERATLINGEPSPKSAGAAATGDGTLKPLDTSDRIDARILGIPVDKALGAAAKIPLIGQFLRNPRLEMQDAMVRSVRDALDVLDNNPWITARDKANFVAHEKNFPGEFRDIKAGFLLAQQDAEHLWRANKANYKNQDEFGKKIYAAVIQGGRSDDKVVEKAAAGYRKYFDDVLERFRAANLLDERTELNNAESYAPIVHLVANVRADSQRFINVHSEAFYNTLMSDWSQALDAKKARDAANRETIAASRQKLAEKKAEVRQEYGSENSLRSGKFAEVKTKNADELKRQIALQKDTLAQREAELTGRLQEQTITQQQYTIQRTQLRERHRVDVQKINEDMKAELETKLADLKKQRDDKIAAAEKVHNDLIEKIEDKAPNWDKTILRKLTQGRTKAEEVAKVWARQLADGYYDGASQNAVVTGHDTLNQPGLGNVLKSRKSELWQQTAADNGWIETNIFRLTEQYNRRAGVDAALATVLKRVDQKTGDLKGDPLGTARRADIERDYKELLDNARDAGDGPRQEAIAQERDRQLQNFDIMMDFTRGSMSDVNGIGHNMKKAGNAVMMYNSWRLMGGTVMSSLGDPINLVLTNGFKDSFKYGIVPALKNLRTAMKSVAREDLPDIYRINRITGVVMEHQHNSRMAAMADLAGGAPDGKFDAGMQRVNKAFWDYSGITYWTQFWKDTAANVTHARIINAANEGWDKQSPGMKTWLTNLKISEDSLKKIAVEHSKQSQKHSAGVPFGAVDEWADKGLAKIFANALDRESNNVVITPTAGDKLALQATPMGQYIWQFRSYGVSSTARLIGRNAGLASIDDDHRLQYYFGLAALVLAGTMVDGVKSALGDATISGASKDGKSSPFDKYIERWQKTPGEAMYNAIDRSGVLWPVMEPSNVMQKMGLPNIQGAMSLALRDDKEVKSGSSRFAQRGVAESILGPTASLIEDVPRLGGFATAAGGRLIGINDDANMTRSDWARARRLVPFQNAPGIQQIMNYGHQQLGTIFDWPEPK